MGQRMLGTAALVLCFGVGLVVAQDKPKVMTAVGAVAKVQGTMLAVDTGGGKTLQFITSATTLVKSDPGGSVKEEARREGRGVKITEVVHVGDQVSVKYTDVAGKLMAEQVDVLKPTPVGAQKQK